MRSQSSWRSSSDSQTGTVVPSIAVLDTWSSFDWTDGCQIDELQSFQPLTVITRNHVYEIVVLDGSTGRVRDPGRSVLSRLARGAPGWLLAGREFP